MRMSHGRIGVPVWRSPSLIKPDERISFIRHTAGVSSDSTRRRGRRLEAPIVPDGETGALTKATTLNTTATLAPKKKMDPQTLVHSRNGGSERSSSMAGAKASAPVNQQAIHVSDQFQCGLEAMSGDHQIEKYVAKPTHGLPFLAR